jgi:hypothetical protein
LDFAKRIADSPGFSPEPFAEVLICEQLKKAGFSCGLSLTPMTAA